MPWATQELIYHQCATRAVCVALVSSVTGWALPLLWVWWGAIPPWVGPSSPTLLVLGLCAKSFHMMSVPAYCGPAMCFSGCLAVCVAGWALFAALQCVHRLIFVFQQGKGWVSLESRPS